MKRIHMTMTTIMITFMMSVQGNAQISIKLLAGISPEATPQVPGLIVNRHLPHEEFVFNMVQVDPAYYGGIKGHVAIATPFFAEAGLVYARMTSTYLVTYTLIDKEHPIPEHLMKESEHIIQLPVNIGVNMNIIDVTSGFRLSKGVSRNSELPESLTGFKNADNKLRLGWQGSVGVNIFNTRFGVEYHGHFSRVGSGMTVNGQSLELTNIPGQWIFTIQHSL